jgi:hypothetical protein
MSIKILKWKHLFIHHYVNAMWRESLDFSLNILICWRSWRKVFNFFLLQWLEICFNLRNFKRNISLWFFPVLTCFFVKMISLLKIFCLVRLFFMFVRNKRQHWMIKGKYLSHTCYISFWINGNIIKFWFLNSLGS